MTNECIDAGRIIPKYIPAGKYECKHCLKRHPNGWYCKHAIAVLEAELAEAIAWIDRMKGYVSLTQSEKNSFDLFLAKHTTNHAGEGG